MPRLTVLAVRAALIYFLAGFSLGALLLTNKGIPFSAQVWQLLPAHVEFLLMGWTVQLALGVAFWILPRYPGGSRGNETPARLSVLMLNLGVLLVAVQTISPVFLATGRSLEALSGLFFAIHAWGRVRPLVFPEKGKI